MKPLILVLEDNPDIQTYVKLMLEHNDYRVITADDGEDGLKVLSETSEIPDLIISDINMPKMDGYEFFQAISENDKFLRIPFIFLSALDSPEDIRLGKLLGADDYLTKPIKEDDLLAVVTGKITRNKRFRSVNENLQELLKSIDSKPTTTDAKKSQTGLLLVEWDDIIGPKVEGFYSEDTSFDFSIEDVGTQLYEAANTIYGRAGINKAEGILVNIENLQMSGYAFFDVLPNPEFRGGTQEYMFAVIAPNISYLHSLQIKNILNELSIKFKKKEEWNIKEYWDKIFNALKSSII